MQKHPPALAFFGPLLLLLALLVQPAGAQEGGVTTAGPAAYSEEQISGLIDTLEDEQARRQLIERLQLLLAAQQETDEGPASPAISALQELSSLTAGGLHQTLQRLFEAGEVQRLGGWLRQQFEQSEHRRAWAATLGELLTILASGYLVLSLIHLSLRSTRRRLREGEPATWWRRASSRVALTLLEALPAVGFWLAAYLVFALIAPQEPSRLVALAWITAILLMRLTGLLVDTLLSSRVANLRLLPISDENAHYMGIWSRRLAGTAIYGYFVIQTGLFLGLPQPVHAALLHLLGLLLILLLVILIVQSRRAVAAWIAGAGSTRNASALRSRVAAVWHLPAILYLLLLYGIWATEADDGFAWLINGSLLSILSILTGLLALHLVKRLFERTYALPEELQQHFPGLQERANRYLPALHGGIRLLIFLLLALALLQSWGIDSLVWLGSDPGQALAAAVGSVLLILAAALLLWEISTLAIEAYLARQAGEDQRHQPSPRSRTLLSVARTALAVTLSLVTLLLVLSQIGIDITPLLATAGVLGLAVGFGAQKLVQDLITGFFILLEDLFSVGDVIKVGDRAGLVEAVSIRTVRLRDLSGTVHTLPFSTIDTISNLTKEFSFHVFEIGVAYREDADQVMQILREVGAEMRADDYYGTLIIEDPEVLGLDRFDDSAIVIKGRIKTLPIKQWETGREFNRRVKQRFDALSIEIPFPHRTLYFGIDKEGRAPPMQLLMTGLDREEPDADQT